MQLRLWILSGTAIFLWLVPLYALDKKVMWHRAIQGTSLIAAFSCAIAASITAKKLSEFEKFEQAKKIMLLSDATDELAQNTYLLEQERKILGQRYLESISQKHTVSEPETTETTTETAETTTDGQYSQTVERFTCFGLTRNAAETLIAKLRNDGKLNQSEIISMLWQAKPGSSKAYELALAEFRELSQND
jgi:hypothetical protein